MSLDQMISHFHDFWKLYPPLNKQTILIISLYTTLALDSNTSNFDEVSLLIKKLTRGSKHTHEIFEILGPLQAMNLMLQ